MAYNPDEASTQQRNLPADAPSAQPAGDRPAEYPPDEAPTQRRIIPPPRSAPSPQNRSPLQSEHYSPAPQGDYLPSQPSGPFPPQASYPPPQGESMSPWQESAPAVPPGGYWPPQPGGYPPQYYPTSPQGGYPPPPQGSYPAPQPGGYPPSQRGYSSSQPGYTQAPSNATPTPANHPPSPGPTPYSHHLYPPAQPASGAYPAPATHPAFNVQQFWHNLSLLGQVAGIAGALLVIFFFLPWFYTPDFGRITALQSGNTIPTASHSGWSTAAGQRLFTNVPSLNLFPHLWLVLLGALALIAIAVLLGLRRISVRLAASLITLISLGALLLEFFFLIQASSIEGAVHASLNNSINQSLYGVSWGFWLAVIATIAALGVGIYMALEAFAPGTFRRTHAAGSPGSAQHLPPTP